MHVCNADCKIFSHFQVSSYNSNRTFWRVKPPPNPTNEWLFSKPYFLSTLCSTDLCGGVWLSLLTETEKLVGVHVTYWDQQWCMSAACVDRWHFELTCTKKKMYTCVKIFFVFATVNSNKLDTSTLQIQNVLPGKWRSFHQAAFLSNLLSFHTTPACEGMAIATRTEHEFSCNSFAATCQPYSKEVALCTAIPCRNYKTKAPTTLSGFNPDD